MYGAEIWANGLNTKKNNTKILQFQRREALRICSGYRTMSTEVSFVIAGVIPLDILAEERKALGEKRNADKKVEREKSLEKWQQRWSQSLADIWTHKLIQNVKPWVTRKHGSVDYYMTQVISGHGCFRTYLKKIGKIQTVNCINCNEEDNPGHAILECPR